MNNQGMEHSKNSTQININRSSQSCALGDARRQSQDAGMTKDGNGQTFEAQILYLRMASHVVCQNIFYGTNFVQPFPQEANTAAP